jgi:RHS repeat-associated protein
VDTGLIEGRYEYDAFGTPYQGDFSSGMNLGYTGKSYDPATGLYNYGFRDYAPQVARFTTVDPVRDGSNWFAYVNNDPVNYVDLWGLQCIPGSDKQAIDNKKQQAGTGIEVGVNVRMQVGPIKNEAGAGIKIDGNGIDFNYNAKHQNPLFEVNINISSRFEERDTSKTASANALTGTPGSTSRIILPDGNPKQDRVYANDGYPNYDIDYDHNHGQGQPHQGQRI